MLPTTRFGPSSSETSLLFIRKNNSKSPLPCYYLIKMATEISMGHAQVPLLDSFLHNLNHHIEELLVRLSKLCEIRTMLSEDQEERCTRLDLLIKQCSLELHWTVTTFQGYRALRQVAAFSPDI
ncbi:hypothetical protein NM208_g13333 [Fusarium decemcellulare]|uniref:Uncharacterized protein n=1 Tax=Fusarium decemcellulare TaxID=57161 RepID=A0ACC1RLE4_9HYPO|nr:hypothetical protein NM208_g13333 [Fusarium decemcellulare]